MLQIVCELLMDRGDFILCEEYTYPSVIESVMIPKGYKALGLDMDQDGILPHSLQQVIHFVDLHCNTPVNSTLTVA